MIQESSTDVLRQSMVDYLMRIIGLPDDEALAHEADDVVRALDARLEAERHAVA
ncbi:hypothetical protein [Streptomyces griseocarneus]|uniref:hypothetical protein n=1 Tax=Streptomyces griseocarneus TaxID=51201 RepID=UPI00167D8141|nr:hypothetical protein [Streptomyces griseocarneus]MBZ6474945.1 hypothetical protein [Streptomyces griseocarneus]GHG49022.1 hypothetical protein GCM10018779_07670 [Streptomyces griseocarneus]